jgi:hypothetical protein
VHRPLGNALAVLVGELLEQLIILQQDRAARTGGDRVLVIRDRIAASGGERGFIGHGARPSGLLPSMFGADLIAAWLVTGTAPQSQECA